MHLDMRLPIGGLFCLIGLILVTYGALSEPSIYARSLGININIWWGGVLFAFGAAMLLLSRKTFRGGLKHPRVDNP